MCAPVATHSHQGKHASGGITRRKFLTTGAAISAGAAMATAAPPLPAAALPKRPRHSVDLTHRLVKAFPSFFGPEVVSDEIVNDFDTTGFYSKRWTFEEHIGTHIDTPGHFDEGNRLVDEMTPGELLAPIVVIDIQQKAMDDPNATVDVSDLIDFERGHGRIPRRALVCMNSGWAAKVSDPDEFRGGSGFPDLNFPGFSGDATDWLVTNRNPAGIGLDTMSLDPGNSTDFAVHTTFLATGRYGVESMTNLDQIPPRGALGFVGPIPWEEGSGSPCRVIAAW